MYAIRSYYAPAPFDVGVVEGRRLRQRLSVVVHPLEYEAVQPVARPGVVAAQRLEDDERFAELFRPFRRMLQRNNFV